MSMKMLAGFLLVFAGVARGKVAAVAPFDYSFSVNFTSGLSAFISYQYATTLPFSVDGDFSLSSDITNSTFELCGSPLAIQLAVVGHTPGGCTGVVATYLTLPHGESGYLFASPFSQSVEVSGIPDQPASLKISGNFIDAETSYYPTVEDGIGDPFGAANYPSPATAYFSGSFAGYDATVTPTPEPTSYVILGCLLTAVFLSKARRGVKGGGKRYQ